MASSASSASGTVRPMRPLVPFFIPGSLERNNSLTVDPSFKAVEEPLATVAVRKWDRETGVFVEPQIVQVRQTTTTYEKPVAAAAAVLLTPAAIAARCKNKSDNLCARAPPSKIDAALLKRELPTTPIAKPERPAFITHTRRSRSDSFASPKLDMLKTEFPHEPRTFTKTTNVKPNATRGKEQVSKPETTAFTRKTRYKTEGRTKTTDVSPPRVSTPTGSECSTPDSKRRAADVSPVGSRKIDIPVRSPHGVKYAGMSFEAASPSPISIPIPRLAERRHSCVVPGQEVKLLHSKDPVLPALIVCGDENGR